MSLVDGREDINDSRSSKELKEFDNFESEEYVTSAQKSQLELYSDEPRIDRNTQPDLDILQYKKAQQFHYPDLSKMELDILAIPITTVASESAFSIGGRVLDQYRSSLKLEVIEALICTRDWIFGNEGGVLFRLLGSNRWKWVSGLVMGITG
ncbi:hypothetical protein ACH5RR_032323 [Cinchona calisaya]|uniref:HAT C-terminal dimerisation domain-containing protein n=1 Tax=Cinchona calisaya TaxID=153742 RepID=A0ABD2YJ40_9GENT